MDAIAAAMHEEFHNWYDELSMETANLQLTSINNEEKGFFWEMFA